MHYFIPSAHEKRVDGLPAFMDIVSELEGFRADHPLISFGKHHISHLK